jgi:hypothetical protein
MSTIPDLALVLLAIIAPWAIVLLAAVIRGMDVHARFRMTRNGRTPRVPTNPETEDRRGTSGGS